MKKELLIILSASVWQIGVLAIALYGLSAWHIWTWIPLLGYIGGSFTLAYKFNVARKAVQNSSGGAYDAKKWLSSEEMSAMVRKTFARRS